MSVDLATPPTTAEIPPAPVLLLVGNSRDLDKDPVVFVVAQGTTAAAVEQAVADSTRGRGWYDVLEVTVVRRFTVKPQITTVDVTGDEP